MHIISHRGYWQKSDEKNCGVAFRRSFDFNFGTETDIRDSNGQLVISHDMPTGNEMLLADLLKILDNRNLTLALNIKADGLATQLKKTMRAMALDSWFVFDISIPYIQLFFYHFSANNQDD